MKVAYIDFCHTLLSTYTLGKFFRYCLIKKKAFLSYLLYRLRIKNEQNLIHEGVLNKADLNLYGESFATKLLKFKKKKVINKVLSLRKDDYKLVIISAGMREYISPFCQKLNIKIDNFLTSEVNSSSFIFNYGNQKELALREFERKEKAITHRIGISDHISDIYFLNLCDY